MPDDFGEVEETVLRNLRRDDLYYRVAPINPPIYTVDGKHLFTPHEGRMVQINRTLHPSTLERAVEDPHLSPRHVLGILATWARRGLLWIALPLGLWYHQQVFVVLTGGVLGLHGCRAVGYRLRLRRATRRMCAAAQYEGAPQMANDARPYRLS